jgi:hypothetical protein
MMPGCGESRLSAWISRRLLTYGGEVRGRVRRGRSLSYQRSGWRWAETDWARGGGTCSRLSKWFFMHLIATYLPFLMHCAFRTSEKVPSPFLPMSRYSGKAGARVAEGCGRRAVRAGGD